MGKIFLSVLFSVMILFETAGANPYENDQNYVYVWRYNYLDLRTVTVQENSPPYYIIKGDFIYFDTKNSTSTAPRTVTIKFDELAQLTFLNKDGVWKSINVFGTDSSATSNRKVADVLFKAAFGREFYGENFTRKANGIDDGVPELATNRIAIGGIELGATPERVRSIYGAPSNVRKLYGRDLSYWNGKSGEEWFYGNSFRLGFIDGHLMLAGVTSKNGIKTPDGISVGDGAEKIYRAYGRAAKYAETPEGKLYAYKNGYNYLSFKLAGDKIISIGIFVEL